MNHSKFLRHKLMISMTVLLTTSFFLLTGCEPQDKVDERPKAKGFVWTATKGEYTVNLIGTMHPAPSTHNFLNDNILDILNKTDVLSVEVDLTESANISKLRNSIKLPNDETIDEYLSKEDIKELNSILEDYNQKTNIVRNLNAYGLTSTLNSLLSLDAGFIGRSSDEILIDYAKSKNIEVTELEGVNYQTDMLNSIYTWDTVKESIDAFYNEDKDKSIDDLKKLFDAYVSGDTSIPEKLNEEQQNADPETYEVLVINRNKEMAEAIDAMITDGKKHTIAVGYRHFISDMSILTELENKGYTITKL